MENRSPLKTLSLVVTDRQAKQLRKLQFDRANDVRRVSLSDVAREVIEAGLNAVSSEPNTASDATADLPVGVSDAIAS